MLITIIEIERTWVSQMQNEVGHIDVAVHSGRCMQGAEEYIMQRRQVNCADTQEQLKTGKLDKKNLYQISHGDRKINVEGSASYGRLRSALASSVSCSSQMMSVALDKIFCESAI